MAMLAFDLIIIAIRLSGFALAHKFAPRISAAGVSMFLLSGCATALMTRGAFVP
ncbi:hypothetical protein [Bradyrhizobium sp. F1.13.3]|uniref:hypothetical protein n=1 Tax=Bradyrhizobium sp. F1.13.3 TaxID=3156351 RepID=UPI0033955F10